MNSIRVALMKIIHAASQDFNRARLTSRLPHTTRSIVEEGGYCRSP